MSAKDRRCYLNKPSTELGKVSLIMGKIHVSVGVCAYREDKNVQTLLESILNQHLEEVCIDEIIVVWDGYEDSQSQVADFIKGKPVRLLISQHRQGKFAAVNQFLKEARSDVLVLSSADLTLGPDAIERLCLPFLEPRVGMSGGRPIPMNKIDTMFGYIAHLQWGLHHCLSLKTPKFGELVAFRRVLDHLPPTLVDEEEIGAVVKSKGYELRYVPEACVYNKGVENFSDFLKQRRRTYAGHLDLKKRQGYSAATLNGFVIVRCLFKDAAPYWKRPLWLFAAVVLESLVRLLGWFDFILGRNRYDWPIAKSTKSFYE